MTLIIKGKVNASPLITSAEEVEKAIKDAILNTVFCQLYDFEITVTEEKADVLKEQ